MKTLQFIKISRPHTHVALVELSRKPVNAFNEPFWKELGEVFDTICSPEEGENDVRVVVLASTLPKVWTAGLDLLSVGLEPQPDPARQAFYLRQHILEFQSAISSIERCPVPVIAAVHGLAIGLAIDILAACDVRYASADASFAIKEVDVGLAADIGTLARLQKATGNASLAHELAYTARAFPASEALALGLLSRVVDGGRDAVVAAALESGKVVAAKSPVAIAGTKRLLLHARDHSVAENLEYTAIWNSVMVQASDFGDSVRAFKTKKAPQYQALPKLKGKL